MALHRPRPGLQLAKLLGLLILGGVCGVAAKTADGSGIRWVSDLGNYPAMWVFVLALIGRLAPTAVHAALRSTVFFVAVCVAYYSWSTHVLGFGGGLYVYLWVGLSLTVVPSLAVAVTWASTRGGAAPGLVMGAAAGLVLADGVVWQLWRFMANGLPPEFPLHPVQALVGAVLAVLIAGVLPSHGRTRMWALALTVPMAWATGALVNWVRAYLLPI